MNQRFRKISWSVVLIAALGASSAAADLVKKRRSDIWHDAAGPYYSRTKNFESFDNLAECLNSGGRLPKNRRDSRAAPRLSSVAPSPGDSRDKFGSGWDDVDGDCIAGGRSVFGINRQVNQWMSHGC